MAWSKVYYDTSRQDQVTSTAAVDDRGNVTSVTQQFVCTYIAVDDATGAQPDTLTALGASAGGNTVPAVGSSAVIAGTTGWTVTQAMPKRSGQSPFVFEVQVNIQRKYTVQPGSADKWNIDIAVKGSKVTQEAYQDKDGADIVNSAGEAFDPSIQETHYDEQISVSFNTLAPPDLSAFRGHVNSGSVSFTIRGLSRDYGARQLLLDEGEMSTTLTLGDNSTPVWKVSLVFLARTDTFQDKILDRGYNKWETIAGVTKLTSCVDFKTNQPLSAPALLNGDGTQQSPGDTPHYKIYKIEPEADLSSLFSGL